MTGKAEKPKSKKPRLISFRIRKSPYFEATERYGCRAYTTYNNMYLPLVYQDLVSDYWHIKKGVTLWDVGCQRQVEITPGGGILNDPVCTRVGESQFWLSIADRDIHLWARGLAAGYKMDVQIQEPDVSPLAVQGPKSFDVVADLFGDWVRELKYFWFREVDFQGMPIILARSGWSKQGGYELYLRDSSYGDQLWETVMEAGKPYDIQPATPSSIERVESGLLNYWEDLTEETNPFEVGLGNFVDLDQEVNFIGKAALKETKSAGIKRKLVGLKIHSEPMYQQAQPWQVECDGKVVGKITSAVYSPDLDQNIAYALVAIECSDVGKQVLVDIDGEKVEASVTRLPFIDNREVVWSGLLDG